MDQPEQKHSNHSQLDPTARQEAGTAPRVTPEQLNENIVDVEIVKHVSHAGQVLRWAVLTVANGFAVTGRPSCAVSSENDDSELGVATAIANAKEELWPLMGYELKQRQHNVAKLRALIKGSPELVNDELRAQCGMTDEIRHDLANERLIDNMASREGVHLPSEYKANLMALPVREHSQLEGKFDGLQLTKDPAQGLPPGGRIDRGLAGTPAPERPATITPTVGRIVWFWPHPLAHTHMTILGEQPMAAQIAFVHSTRQVNLRVIDHMGYAWDVQDVELVQEGGAAPSGAAWCQWMPYQVGQARKA